MNIKFVESSDTFRVGDIVRYTGGCFPKYEDKPLRVAYIREVVCTSMPTYYRLYTKHIDSDRYAIDGAELFFEKVQP